jgi:hypothetical protein
VLLQLLRGSRALGRPGADLRHKDCLTDGRRRAVKLAVSPVAWLRADRSDAAGVPELGPFGPLAAQPDRAVSPTTSGPTAAAPIGSVTTSFTSSRAALRAAAGRAAACQVAGAVARPGSHRTVLALFAHGSSGRRVVTPAAGRLSTITIPEIACTACCPASPTTDSSSRTAAAGSPKTPHNDHSALTFRSLTHP